ncbi:DUF4105 domain-containing protein [Lysobacter enzymogenes]|uniref:Lnb N-terminal periplasmic domain-containing protein n=1 Tax=Lysobacter enzymogenes TaxID=69 RepID=UPI000BBAD00E|nr:DUF4105 domain-containing protein [Lysobacter enzymogenes]
MSVQTIPPAPGRGGRWVRIVVRSLAAAAIAAATAWGAGLIGFQFPGAPPWRVVLIAVWCALGAASVVTLVLRRAAMRKPTLTAFAAGLAALLAWWLSLAPSHHRDWADDVARLLDAQVSGDRVVLRNVRNFQWRSETDYTPHWETREYDLSRLSSADLVLSYWMGPDIAHTLVSFGFDDGRRVVFSLEIRKERGESFSALGGFFRRYEQVLVAADERDIVRTRSNARGEDVYLYRLNIPPQTLRPMFLGFLAKAGALQREPAFYNTLTSNCTTVVFEIARHVVPDLPLDYRLLAAGHFAEYVYDRGGLTPGYSYSQLHERGYINPRALAVPADADAGAFSRAIRRGVPGIPVAETEP